VGGERLVRVETGPTEDPEAPRVLADFGRGRAYAKCGCASEPPCQGRRRSFLCAEFAAAKAWDFGPISSFSNIFFTIL
jgi:hypothetical protein